MAKTFFILPPTLYKGHIISLENVICIRGLLLFSPPYLWYCLMKKTWRLASGTSLAAGMACPTQLHDELRVVQLLTAELVFCKLISGHWVLSHSLQRRLLIFSALLFSLSIATVYGIESHTAYGVGGQDANTKRCTIAGLMLDQRRRRWPNIKPALVERPVFAGICGPV